MPDSSTICKGGEGVEPVEVYIYTMSDVFGFFSTGAQYGFLMGGIAFLLGFGVVQAVKIIKLA